MDSLFLAWRWNKLNLAPRIAVILSHFVHIFPKEIPLNIPPKKSIQHHVDLIVGALLPYKPTHKIKFKDTYGGQRLIELLLAKRIVKKNLNPCEVPAFLHLRKMEV